MHIRTASPLLTSINAGLSPFLFVAFGSKKTLFIVQLCGASPHVVAHSQAFLIPLFPFTHTSFRFFTQNKQLLTLVVSFVLFWWAIKKAGVIILKYIYAVRILHLYSSVCIFYSADLPNSAVR